MIGSVRVVDCRPSGIEDRQAACVEPQRGSFSWELEEAEAFAVPIKFSGRLNIFVLPEEIRELIALQSV